MVATAATVACNGWCMPSVRRLMMRRLAAAGALAVGLSLAVAPRPAAACSWVPPSLDEVTAAADYVFVGVVTEVPALQTYVVEVERVFRGAPPASMTFRPDPEDLLTTCMVLEAGERYVIGTDRVEGPLYVGQVWYHLDGEVANGTYLLNWPGTVDELFAELAALPDTALARDAPHAGVIRLSGWLFIGLAVAILAHPLRGARREVRRALPSALVSGDAADSSITDDRANLSSHGDDAT